MPVAARSAPEMSYRAGDPAAHDYDYIFKLLLIGQSGVGKSQLLQR